MYIENRNLFFDRMRSGINIFAGAGFSKLVSPSGRNLPDGNELCSTLCEQFDGLEKYGNDLEKISSLLKITRKEEFQRFLRDTYRVTDYNSLYDVINLINCRYFITTNIDNIVPTVISKSSTHYLNNVSYYGNTRNDGSVIEYVPLHGDVLNCESELYFGKFELCSVSNKNRGEFAMMHTALLTYPTLFWGYGFHDGSVLDILSQTLTQKKQDMWIQVLPNSDTDLFRALGCNIIEATTEELLAEIGAELETTNLVKRKTDLNNLFADKYRIPSMTEVSTLPINEFYEQGKTHWYYIISDKAYQTRFVENVVDESLCNKNLIVAGIPFGGKTVLSMQVARKYGKVVYYADSINNEEAKLVCNTAQESENEIVFLLDNCADDMKAYQTLARCEKVRVIGFCDDYTYETSKHILEGITYKRISIPDLDNIEASKMYSNIPSDIRRESFVYKKEESERYSSFELITNNVKNIVSKSRVADFLRKVKGKDEESFEIILLTAYLFHFRSALSTGVLWSYLSCDSLSKIKTMIDKAKLCLREVDVTIEEDHLDQDYFVLRSNLFAKCTHEAAITYFRKEYADVIKRFVNEVPPCNVYRNYIFKRRAYDADLFYTLFGNDGDDVYQNIYNNDSSAYTLQQWALYKAKTGRYQDAFVDIDDAIHMQPYNFSIKNARAIILFEANKGHKTDESLTAMKEAMSILEECYYSDKRKIYHAQKYAEYALYFADEINDNEYMLQAKTWLEELSKDENTSKYTKNLLKELSVRGF